MNRHWVTLEYPEILRRLANYTDFSGGKALALELAPTSDVREAHERLRLTSEARGLLNSLPDFVLGGVRDIRPFAEQAEHGVSLRPRDLLQVRDTLQAAARIRRTLTRLETQFAGLADIAWRIQPAKDLVEAISRVLDDRGEIRDNASPELARIRRELRINQDRIQERLQNLLSSRTVAPYLQESLITRREGRFVIPVQSDFKAHVQGIIHDRSSSGVTVFIEPTQVVELNNALRELSLAEEDEIIRLLRELTFRIAEFADEILVTIDALSELDLTFAKARYAEAILATEPDLAPAPDVPLAVKDENVHPGTVLRLLGARHPLLDPETVVPVNVDADPETHVLVITGPNTGGKTVSLKTVGLLTLMAQAGMHIPVDKGSRLTCFEHVYADIGDEQSIEQSLSTFSSHLTNILSFLETVDHRDLVLLDELGAGTDPAEGAALARALLDAFRLQRCTTLVATHYPDLKLYAHNVAGVQNASMEFDVETLAPTYRLVVGLPGRSNAFAIARRLGMPEDIVKRAQKMISGEELRTEDMLTDLHNLRIQEVHARDKARSAQQEAESLTSTLRTRLAHIEEEREQVLQEAESEAQAQIDTLREELETLRRRMRSAPLSAAKATIDQVEAEVEEAEATISRPAPLLGSLLKETDEALTSDDIGTGDRVRLVSLGIEGVVVELEDDVAVVQAGALHTRVVLDELELVKQPQAPKPQQATINVPARASSPGVQLDLRGQIVEEALTHLDRYLDEAAMAALPWVRVVHGKGTGTLRRAVRRFMDSHPLVASYKTAPRNEGGDGATVVNLVQPR